MEEVRVPERGIIRSGFEGSNFSFNFCARRYYFSNFSSVSSLPLFITPAGDIQALKARNHETWPLL